MKYQSICSKSLVCVAATCFLAGCSGVLVFPNSTVNPTSSAVGAISGSNFGGHAPLVGAHIYLVQPGTTGYGSVVTSLLNVNANASTYPLVANGSWPAATSGGNSSDQFVPTNGDNAGDTNTTPFYGVTTNVNGEFALSGDYTCTVGLPVILIGYGGYPSFVPTSTSGTNTFNISSITVGTPSGVGNGTGSATYTFNVSGSNPELFYPGESVTFSGTSIPSQNGSPTLFNSGTFTVSGTNLSTTSFQITANADYGTGSGYTTPYFAAGTYSQSGATVTATPAFNPAATNMAVLGNCPSNGTFATGASALRYVYMNEISTAATAYAFAGFVNTAANNQFGQDEFHIGAPSVNLVGLQNAAMTAGALYDIQGGNTAANNPDGDVHIARTTTPSGTGTVPQTQIDTIGNILAACVDSNNTYRLGTGTKSTQCQTLGFYASDNGVYDTTLSTTHQAFNIAQAAFNMARFPQGNGTGSSTNCNASNYCTTQTISSAPSSTTASAYTTALYNLPTGNVPFTPQLSSAPGDFSIAIQWSDATANGGTVTNGVASGGNSVGTTDLAVDAQGNVWTPSATYNVTGGVFEFKPSTGLYTAYTGAISTNTPGIAIDASGNAWVSGATGAYKFTPGTTAGTQVGAANATYSESIAVDASNVYMMQNGDLAAASLAKQSKAGTAAGGNFPVQGAVGAGANTAAGCLTYGQYLTVDSVGNIWTVSADSNDYLPDNSICEFTSAGVLQYSYNFSGKYNQTLPHSIEVDASNNAWVADKNNNLLEKYPAGMTTSQNGTGAIITSGGSLSEPKGIAIDGANTIWVSNQNGGILHFTDSNVALSGTVYKGGGTTTDLIFAAVDPSGNVWTSATSEGQLVQFVGAATPTVLPIAAAKAAGTVGGKPGLTVAHITAYNVGSVGSNIAQFYAADNALTVGETITLSGFPVATFFNGQTITITASSGGLFSGSFTHANVSPTTEVGVASAMN